MAINKYRAIFSQALRLSLAQFAELNKLNIIFDQDVAGTVNVEFRNLTLEQALNAILDPIGLGWVEGDGVIRIVRQITRTYHVDYLKAARSGSASMSSSSTGSGATGSNSISKSDMVDFWADLQKELTSLLAKSNAEEGQRSQTPLPAGQMAISATPVQQVEGRITMDKISGTVVVTTSPRLIKAVDSFMTSVLQGINRQVYIEVRILDVTLTDDNSFGIDWSRVQIGQSMILSTVGAAGGGNIISATAAGTQALPGTGFLGYNKTMGDTSAVQSIAAAIRALQQQGTVRMLSQPRIRTLNNQPAVMKVGTDRTFYSKNMVITSNAGGNLTSTTYTPTQVTEGIVLSVTPQISDDKMISLDVMPVINNIIGVDTSADGSANAPQVDTKQASTMVRLRDGQTAVIGGLIQESASDTTRAVPGLGNIPVLGWMFKGVYNQKVRRELVIFITPHLIEN
jgi:MSHA type pilus biogenesis protein MshL